VRSRRILIAAAVAVAAAVLVAHSLAWNFVTDDAFISFVYSRNFARHGQLVFNLGERVEGYTNFLWTVLLAGLMKVGLAPELMSRVLGTAFGAATLATVAFASRRMRGAATGTGAAVSEWSLWDALPAIVLAGVPGYACWSSGGLETQLFTFFVTLGFTLYLGEQARDAPGRSAIAFGLAALTRPEGILFFALTAAHRGASALARKRIVPTRAELRWLALFAAFVVPHLVWRRWYYGWWLPNTFYIKSSGGAAAAWAQGGYYLAQLTLRFHLWIAPLLVIAGLARRRTPVAPFVYAAWIVGAFCIYVASVGGDFMGLYRFALPIVPLVVVCATVGLSRALDGVALPAQAAVVALLVAAHAWHAVRVDRESLVIGADRGPAGNIDTPGYLRWYTADRAAIGKWFAQYAQPDDYANVGGAGAQVYYSGIRSLDCFGLSDAYIAHQVPATSARPGHQKYAPLDYELSKHPTIITSHYYNIGPAPHVGPDADFWRTRGYHYVSVQVPGLSSPWYSFLLRNDRRLGPVGGEGASGDREP
jgi:arabinofuranosyltransferase